MSRPIVAAVVLMFVAACDSAGIVATPPFVAASATTIDFGEQTVGREEERTIFLINKGSVGLSFEVPQGDTLGGIFAVLLDEFIAAPSEDVVVRVKFRPADPQAYSTLIKIPNTSQNEPELLLTLSGTGVLAGPCDGVDCSLPPRPFCVTGTISRHYQPLGQCVDGRCEHEYRDESCEFGCDAATGARNGDPCIGMACNSPPSPCYFAEGMCERGACRYLPNNAGNCSDDNLCTSGDHCEEGNCVGAPVVCDQPPAPYCLPGDVRRAFDLQGVCTSSTGACSYRAQEQPCPFGCDPAGCAGDPCLGIVCDQPPSPCYEATGTCMNGSCSYPTRSGSCDDNNACTVNDSCNNGACAGQPMPCSSPPGPECADPNNLRSYQMNGTCISGRCEYPSSTRNCDDSNLCTLGDACNNGACTTSGTLNCDDGNPCTNDSCNPGSGCQRQAASGVACVTTSGDCPQGTCSAGSCLPNAGVACLTDIQVDLCREEDIAGICAGDGRCVVTQVPPRLQCPGCNGICLQCFFIQICIPF